MEKYFVCSDLRRPQCIKFDVEEAKKTEYNYIDVFDEEGIHMYSLKYVNEKYGNVVVLD